MKEGDSTHDDSTTKRSKRSIRLMRECRQYLLDKPAPSFAEPSISVGVTQIDETEIKIIFDGNVLVSPDWIWDRRVSYPNMKVGKSASFSSLAVCWQSDALFPYQDVLSTFNF